VTVAALRSYEGTKLYDLVAAAPLVVWYALCGAQLLPALTAQIGAFDAGTATALYYTGLASKLASLFFIVMLLALLVLRRPPKAKAPGLLPRVAAIAGTYLGVAMLWLPARPLPAAAHLVSALLILGGTLFALYSVAYLGRSISIMAEARRLVTDGPYARIRHPLYLGEAVALVGLMMEYFSLWAVILFALQFIYQIQRMKNEEKVLAGIFPAYDDYKSRTKRLVPGLY
jgi:protein-S-isoprenylcysteine O-methyltransferase Ste14